MNEDGVSVKKNKKRPPLLVILKTFPNQHSFFKGTPRQNNTFKKRTLPLKHELPCLCSLWQSLKVAISSFSKKLQG
jgi:hypothetical protein